MFDPSWHFFGPEGDCVSSKDYEAEIYSIVEADLDESLRGGSAPVKSAYEVFRHLRDLMRTVIEFKGFSLESYMDFRDNIKTRVNRLVAGPPVLRSKQLLALIDADVVTVPFGPLPAISWRTNQGLRAAVEAPRTAACRAGGLAHPWAPRESDHLPIDLDPAASLWQEGRLKPLSYGETAVGSVALNEEFHPIDARGQAAERIWLFGSLTEGVRYFTHYVPSPEEPAQGFPRRAALRRGNHGLRIDAGPTGLFVDDRYFLVEKPVNLQKTLVV